MDRDGNPCSMADAWSTVVTREPEYDEYTQARVMALQAWESQRCGSCGNYDSLVPLPMDERHVTWEEHGGQKFTVQQFRCLACGASDLIQRDLRTRHENDKPHPGRAAPFDGRMFVARPLDDEE